jgi:hypothetical protein
MDLFGDGTLIVPAAGDSAFMPSGFSSGHCGLVARRIESHRPDPALMRGAPVARVVAGMFHSCGHHAPLRAPNPADFLALHP